MVTWILKCVRLAPPDFTDILCSVLIINNKGSIKESWYFFYELDGHDQLNAVSCAILIDIFYNITYVVLGLKGFIDWFIHKKYLYFHMY